MRNPREDPDNLLTLDFPLVAKVAGSSDSTHQEMVRTAAWVSNDLLRDCQAEVVRISASRHLTTEGKRHALQRNTAVFANQIAEATGAAYQGTIRRAIDCDLAKLNSEFGSLSHPPGSDLQGETAREEVIAQDVLEKLKEGGGERIRVLSALNERMKSGDRATARAVRFRLMSLMSVEAITEAEWADLHWSFKAGQAPELANRVREQEATLATLEANANRVMRKFSAMTGHLPPELAAERLAGVRTDGGEPEGDGPLEAA